MDEYRELELQTRSRMLEAFDAAAARGDVSAPALMTDDGQAKYFELVREALATGTADSLVAVLSRPDLWQLVTFDGYGNVPVDWQREAELAGRQEFRRWYETGVGSPQAGTGATPLPEASPFVVEDGQFYFHPLHRDFYINSFGGALFFTRIPGTRLNLNVTLDQIHEGDWQEFQTADGTPIPVEVRREGARIVARWRASED